MNLRIMSTPTPETSAKTARERRRNFRARLVANYELAVRIWKIEPRVPLDARPMPSKELKVLVTELSIGGLSITIPAGGCGPQVNATDRIRIELKWRAGELLLEGRLRTIEIAQKEDGSVVTGIIFRKGDRQLNLLVGALQRAELRLRRGIDTLPAPAKAANSPLVAAAPRV